jgi:hypothetical protein
MMLVDVVVDTRVVVEICVVVVLVLVLVVVTSQSTLSWQGGQPVQQT